MILFFKVNVYSYLTNRLTCFVGPSTVFSFKETIETDENIVSIHCLTQVPNTAYVDHTKTKHWELNPGDNGLRSLCFRVHVNQKLEPNRDRTWIYALHFGIYPSWVAALELQQLPGLSLCSYRKQILKIQMESTDTFSSKFL